jgi:putative flavoprotein involved in K+ transport
MPAPLVTGVRGGHDIDLRAYAAKGMTLAGHVRDIRDGRIAIASDLGESLRVGDQAHADFTRAADDYVRQSDMRSDFPHSEAMRTASTAVPEINEIDIRPAQIATVIWATGYTLDFRWVKLPVFDERGEPVHHRGATSIPGIHFLGLPWLHKSTSSFLSGVGEDAEHLAQSIAEAR